MGLVKRLAKKTLRGIGYDIFSVPRSESEFHGEYAYSLVQPHATLSPWIADKLFMKFYEDIKNDTLLDIYRLFELWTLVQQTGKIGGDIIEVGVWRGGSGSIMGLCEQTLGGKGIVHLCDTSCGVVKTGKKDSLYSDGDHKDTSLRHVKKLIDTLGINNIQIHVGIYPDDTGSSLHIQRVRLLHIDVDVYQSAKDCVEYTWDKIPVGGVIVFDDYGFVGCEGITRYVDELKNRNDLLFIHNINGHAILVKY